MTNKQYKKAGCMDFAPDAGCAFEVRAETDAEVVRVVSDHAQEVHHISSSPEMKDKIKHSIKNITVNV